MEVVVLVVITTTTPQRANKNLNNVREVALLLGLEALRRQWKMRVTGWLDTLVLVAVVMRRTVAVVMRSWGKKV